MPTLSEPDGKGDASRESRCLEPLTLDLNDSVDESVTSQTFVVGTPPPDPNTECVQFDKKGLLSDIGRPVSSDRQRPVKSE